ncbi:hypothetical protein, partial [Candidatus Enterococcus ikei]
LYVCYFNIVILKKVLSMNTIFPLVFSLYPSTHLEVLSFKLYDEALKFSIPKTLHSDFRYRLEA